eukprot:Hpha_TRINITY_DN27861_c0_g1::TRINITY_DN27861_c0_g1_i1::g.194136::m.194136
MPLWLLEDNRAEVSEAPAGAVHVSGDALKEFFGEAAQGKVVFAARCQVRPADVCGASPESEGMLVVWLDSGVARAAVHTPKGRALDFLLSKLGPVCRANSSPDSLLLCMDGSGLGPVGFATVLRFGSSFFAAQAVDSLAAAAGIPVRVLLVSGVLARGYDTGCVAAGVRRGGRLVVAPPVEVPAAGAAVQWVRWMLVHRTQRLCGALSIALKTDELDACGAALSMAAHEEGVAPHLMVSVAALEVREKLAPAEHAVAHAASRGVEGKKELKAALRRREEAAATLFRLKSLATAVFGAYAVPPLQEWAAAAFGFVCPECERLPPGSEPTDPPPLWDPEDYIHRFLLRETAGRVFQAVADGARTGSIPPEVRAVLCAISAATAPTYLQTEPLLGGFVMLRGVNAVLAQAESHALSDKPLSKDVAANLHLLTQVLQAVSNGKGFPRSRAGLCELNEWAKEGTQKLHDSMRMLADPRNLPGGAPAPVSRCLDGTNCRFSELAVRIEADRAPQCGPGLLQLSEIVSRHAGSIIAEAWMDQEAALRKCSDQ